MVTTDSTASFSFESMRGGASRRVIGQSARLKRVYVMGIVGLWMAFAPPAGAADADGKFAVKGAARTTCAHFVTARDGRQEKPRLYVLFGAWLEGYLSAINERSVGTYDLTSFESTELLATLIYSNCKRVPDQPFFNVVRRLVAALNATRIPAFSELVEVNGTVEIEGAEPRDVRLHLYEETVRRVQNNLTSQGLYSGEVDGLYGEATRSAMRVFQKTNSLQVSGLPDQVSLLKLFRPSSATKADSIATPPPVAPAKSN